MTDTKNLSCCFTGHRKIPPEKFDEISQRLENTIIELFNSGYIDFYSGGALGFDTLAAQIILKYKTKHPNIRLILVLPCKNQARRWSESDKLIYESIKNGADKIIYTADAYFRGCMHKRNRYLVEHSCLCVCYLNKSTGGTAYTVNYAADKHIEILNIAYNHK